MSIGHDSSSVLWTGKPWVAPSAAARTVLVAVVAIVISWLEIYFGVAYDTFLNVPLLGWTALVFFIVWLASMAYLLALRATHTYTLRNDRLEIRTGIVTSRSYVVVPSGFSDLEVIQSVVGRMTDSGDIIVRSQSERDGEREMLKVRHPLRVAAQIRDILGKPVVRIGNPKLTREKKQSYH